MKIAVSAKGNSLDSAVDPRFGRTVGFVLFDTQTKDTRYLDNSAQRALTQATGIKTAQMLIEAGTEALVTGQMGPKAAKVLEKSGVKTYACSSGTVRKAVEALTLGRLGELSEVQPGPGKMGGRGMGGGGRGRR
jgi:predicted Fe-Mo cluster-binding NifX family protein